MTEGYTCQQLYLIPSEVFHKRLYFPRLPLPYPRYSYHPNGGFGCVLVGPVELITVKNQKQIIDFYLLT